MVKRRTKKIKLNILFWTSLFVAITFAYFMWLVWEKLTTLIGNSNLVLIITGGIVLVGIATGVFGVNKILDQFI